VQLRRSLGSDPDVQVLVGHGGVDDTSEIVAAGGAASTSPSALRSAVKCGVWTWAYKPSRLAHSSTKLKVLGVSIAS
jgi:hypothetical protein